MAACLRYLTTCQQRGTEKTGYGVDDGFRTRDLRIHNPAL